ncbi:MAG: hypothetical protein BWX58_00588 [Deltaproteobacteria bacterium ADurb.Bin026]|nr:MAG: hypothetical protein BWX58_00588 [Deltaproteobacteria bacterium ADurb.Bin026]
MEIIDTDRIEQIICLFKVLFVFSRKPDDNIDTNAYVRDLFVQIAKHVSNIGLRIMSVHKRKYPVRPALQRNMKTFCDLFRFRNNIDEFIVHIKGVYRTQPYTLRCFATLYLPQQLIQTSTCQRITVFRYLNPGQYDFFNASFF